MRLMSVAFEYMLRRLAPVAGVLAFASSLSFGAPAHAATWGIQATPEAEATAESLADVSCASEADCVAVGLNTLNRRGIIESGEEEIIEVTIRGAPWVGVWAGGSWELDEVPTPANAILSTLTGVSCASASACVAVGWALITSNGVTFDKDVFVVRWDGSSWDLDETPALAEARGDTEMLEAVSCTSASACTAVGSYLDTRGAARRLIIRWNGSEWNQQTTSSVYGSLRAVSCSSATHCAATNLASMVVNTWNGSAWSETELPRPNMTGNAPLSISCTSSTSCVVGGEWEVGRGANVFSVVLSGTNWSVETPSSPAGARATRFEDVSCTAADACVAAGAYTDEGGTQRTLAESWDGERWTILTTPNPRGATSSYLRGISCTAAALCTAVGQSTVSGSVTALVERYA